MQIEQILEFSTCDLVEPRVYNNIRNINDINLSATRVSENGEHFEWFEWGNKIITIIRTIDESGMCLIKSIIVRGM